MVEVSKKQLNAIQSVAVVLGHTMGALTLTLAILLSVMHNTGGNVKRQLYLGGLGGSRTKVFAWHPVMMTATFAFCMTNAVLSFRSLPLGKTTNKALHTMWHTLAIICMGFGVAAVYRSHDHPHPARNGEHTANLSNPHAMFGIMTVSLAAFQYAVGAVTFLFPNIPVHIKKIILPNHVLLGIAVYVMGAAGIVSGASQEALAKLMCDYYKNMKPRDDFDDDTSWLMNSSYVLHERDSNPAEHYHLLPDGCKVISGVALCAGMTCLVTLFAVLSLRVGTDSDVIDAKKDDVAKINPQGPSSNSLSTPFLEHDNDVSQSLA
mmetsp:Transcript_13162/g.39804  ORF Transcript_13162/g.39804 Transcript_13162/m.39804 type:complete len:320 (+) Transcript_13162:190-1149(+)